MTAASMCVQVLLNSQAGDRPGTHAYGPYLLLLDPDQLAVLTMHVVLTHLLGQYQNRAEAGQARLTDIAIVLGKVRGVSSLPCYSYQAPSVCHLNHRGVSLSPGHSSCESEGVLACLWNLGHRQACNVRLTCASKFTTVV